MLGKRMVVCKFCTFDKYVLESDMIGSQAERGGKEVQNREESRMTPKFWTRTNE